MAGRRFTLYFSWDRAAENHPELGVLENRFPTLFELRRAIWPHYEHASGFVQDIGGFLDHVVLFDFRRFQEVIAGLTGRKVELVQRHSENRPTEWGGGATPTTWHRIDDDLLDATDTFIIVSLDHLRTSQAPAAEEIEAIRRFARRPEACLVICPHHDVGTTGADVPSRELEFLHHGDRLVPAVQSLGGFARGLLSAIGVPVENRFGLSPAADPAGNPAPLLVADRSGLDILRDVATFNLHPHLPHLQVMPGADGAIQVLARQPINPAAGSHPFARDHSHFDALIWAPPTNGRACGVFVCDATIWSAAFGGLTSLEAFWRNLAAMPMPRSASRARREPRFNASQRRSGTRELP